MMKVLLTSYYYKPFIGGVENSLLFLAKAYQKQGHEVLVVASDSHPESSTARLSSEEVIDGVKVIRFKTFIPVASMLKVLKYPIEVRTCTKLFKEVEFKADVVVTRHYVTGLAALNAGYKNVVYLVPGIVKFQDTAFAAAAAGFVQKLRNMTIQLFISRYLENIQLAVLKRVNRIFVFSDNMKKQVLRVLAAKGPDVVITRPGVDADYYSDMPTKEKARDGMGIAADKVVYLVLSRLTVHKAIDVAIEAFATLNDQDTLLLIVGDGPEEARLKTMVQRLNLAERVIFAGKTTTPALYYTAADVYLLPSKHETFGQTVIEALAAGLPVVAFISGQTGIDTATSEIVKNGEQGILTNFSVADYAIALADIKNNIDQYKIDKQEVLQNYSWDSLANTLITNNGDDGTK